jgi:flagellin
MTGVTLALNATGTGQATAGDKILIQQVVQAAAAAPAVNATVNGVVGVNVAGDEIGDFDIYNVELDAGGNFVKSRVQISLNKADAGLIRFDTPKAGVAELSTKLRDITSLFTNADGKNILDNTQELTIFGNGKTATVYVEGSDTVEDFQNKLNAALLELGMGTGDSVVDANLVHYVTEEEATEGGNYALAGTYILQGAIAGANSKINIIGDQDLINALSLTTLQNGAENELTVTVRDAHNDKLIGKDTIGDGVLRGIIDGIDVKITNPKFITSFNTATGKMTFTAPDEAIKVNLHIADNRTEVQIGANEGQTFDISIGQMDTTSLEIDDAFVITMEESQKAITKFSQALEKVSSARATIGAQINRLEYTVKNLSISRENLISAESRIRDLDIAEESATFAKNQILVNSAVAMLAQANTLPQIALQLLQ